MYFPENSIACVLECLLFRLGVKNPTHSNLSMLRFFFQPVLTGNALASSRLEGQSRKLPGSPLTVSTATEWVMETSKQGWPKLTSFLCVRTPNFFLWFLLMFASAAKPDDSTSTSNRASTPPELARRMPPTSPSSFSSSSSGTDLLEERNWRSDVQSSKTTGTRSTFCESFWICRSSQVVMDYKHEDKKML